MPGPHCVLMSRLTPHLLPLVRRIAEDVILEVVHRRAIPGRSELRAMQVQAATQAQTLESLRDAVSASLPRTPLPE